MTGSVGEWVEREFATIDLGDTRLNVRFRSILVDLSRHCGKTLASSFENWSKIKASYRFFANPRVKDQAMLLPHIEQSAERIREHDTVLLLQDSTYLDYSNRPKTTGLDLTQRSKLGKASTGLILHNTLAVTCEGLPLGLIDQRFIDRKSFHGNNHQKKQVIRHCNAAISDKESQRWIDVLGAVRNYDLGTTRVIHVADRECDIYEFFRDANELGESVLIRAAQNRSINKRYRREMPKELLFEKLMGKRSQGSTTVRLQVNGKKKFRDAKLSIVRMAFTMPPPPNKTVKKDGGHLPMVPLIAIMAIERNPPKGEEALQWVLLTNLSVDDVEQAIEKVHWYSKRWNIEIFHKVLKSGCGVEKAQLGDAERLKKYVILKSIVAWRLFWLSRLNDEEQNSTCECILSKDEWSILFRKINKTRHAPKEIPTVSQVIRWIAKLGGYIGRAKDPPPGIVSLWRGWQRLSDMIDDQRDLYG